MTLPDDQKAEPSHYWWVERKARRGKKWIFVREYFGAEKATQERFEQDYGKRTDYEFRLRRIYTY